MFCARKCLCSLVLVAAVGVALTGCPPQYNDAPVELMVSPAQLDFGSDAVTREISVTKNATGREMGPLSVTSLDPWLVPQSCANGGTGCVSIGPMDPIRVTVRVDRSRMSLGSNSGALMLHSAGAVSKTVQVVANALLVPDFTASKRSPQPGELVQFTDLTQSADGPVVSLEWDFGDGTKSTASNPSHIFTEERAYQISLRVSTANRTETAVKADFIMVGGQGPIADFTATPLTVFQGETVKFTDRSSSGVGQIKSWAWTFGDSGTSSSASPYHTYQTSGKYSVSLTVANEYGSDTETKQSYIFVQSKVPPVASFVNAAPYVNQYIQFTDTSLSGSMPITERRWNFGDPGGYLNISTQPNPKYMYRSPGTYHVTLTVKTEHGTSTVARDIEVVYAPLTADFTVSRERALVNDNITFTDTSLFGSLPITSWTWDFGDGSTSSDERPVHSYAMPGTYTVKLTVGTGVASSTKTRQALINVFERRALDDFMRRPDFNYSYELKRTVNNYGVTGYIILMTSQQWRTPAEIDLPLWKHWVTILVPPTVTNSTAMLMVSGGSNTSAQLGEPAPSTIDPVLAEVAKDTGSVIVVLNQVPSERLRFLDEFDPRYMVNGRSEDEIISYTFHKYFQTADPTWPLLLTMAKSAVKAMDTVQDFMKKRPSPVIVEDFVVTGASKRGWTTWLTGAYDHRVRAIAPIVIDVLNMDVQMDHHRSSYGFYSEAIIDYVDLFIFEHFNRSDGQALLKIVDPFEYRERLIMPKLIINSTGDEFFLPDSAQFYFHDLLGLRHITYSPNTNHGMGGYQNVIAKLVPWYKGVVEGRDLPVLSWAADDTRIIARTESTPQQVLLWTAISPNRDFRFNTELQPNPPYWSSRTLEPSGLNRYIAEPTRSAAGWTAFFIEFKFESGLSVAGSPAPYTVCTECRVAPPASLVGPTADFYSDRQQAQINEPIQFTDQTAQGTSNISMWEWEFGDGQTSSLRDPVHAYADDGTYTVTLTARSLAGESTKTRTDYITVLEPTGMQSIPDVVGLTEFAARAAIASAGFIVGDVSSEVSDTVPEGVVISQNPPGGEQYIVGTRVNLVISSGSSTELVTVPDLVGMTRAEAEAALLAAHLRVGTISEDTSPTYPVGTVMLQNPAGGASVTENSTVNFTISKGSSATKRIVPNLYQLTEAAAYTAVTNAGLIVGEVESLASATVAEGCVMDQSPDAGTEVAEGTAVDIIISLGPQYTALDDYIEDRPEEPEYEVYEVVARPSATAYVLNMKSGEWLTSAEVDRPEWRHWLSLIVPHEVKSTTALLLVAGGSYLVEPPSPYANNPNWYTPDDEMPYLEQIAVITKSVVALLPQVPCEPLMFWEEQTPGGEEVWRSEDEIIAYSYDKFIRTGDPKWPALFPMVLSAVSAMDTIQDFYETSFVEDFVVTGGSKRGWTTWLTGAVDSRVRAIIPMVIDVLNMEEQMAHHYNAYNGLPPEMHVYGGYSDSVYDYVANDIFSRFNTPGGRDLLNLVDPYEYRTRLYMPKLILNSTGDQFFLPDSTQFYMNEMHGETALRYIPNTDHGLEYSDSGTEAAVTSIATFFQAQLMGGGMPRYTWSFDDPQGNPTPDTIRVTPRTSPMSVKMWYASNPFERDFRLENVGKIWKSQTLYRDNLGDYTATVPTPEMGWTAFMVEMTYTSPIPGVPYVFTTPVRVVPDIYMEGLDYPEPLYRFDVLPFLEIRQPVTEDYYTSTLQPVTSVHAGPGRVSTRLILVNTGYRGLRWEFDQSTLPAEGWLQVSSSRGEMAEKWNGSLYNEGQSAENPGTFELFLDTDSGALPAGGTYSADLRFTTNGYQPDLILSVTMDAGQPGGFFCPNVTFKDWTQNGNEIHHLTRNLVIHNNGTCLADYLIMAGTVPRWLIIDGPQFGTIPGGQSAYISLRADRTMQFPAWYDKDITIRDVTGGSQNTAQIRMQVPTPILTYEKYIEPPDPPNLPEDPINHLRLDFGASLTQASWRFWSKAEPIPDFPGYAYCDMMWSISEAPPGITISYPDTGDILWTSNGGAGAEEARMIDYQDTTPHGYQYKTLQFTLDRSQLAVDNYNENVTVTVTTREGGYSQSASINLIWSVSYTK